MVEVRGKTSWAPELRWYLAIAWACSFPALELGVCQPLLFRVPSTRTGCSPPRLIAFIWRALSLFWFTAQTRAQQQGAPLKKPGASVFQEGRTQKMHDLMMHHYEGPRQTLDLKHLTTLQGPTTRMRTIKARTRGLETWVSARYLFLFESLLCCNKSGPCYPLWKVLYSLQRLWNGTAQHRIEM
jgi:hypothetical protein